MLGGIIGRKIGMTRIFEADGQSVPVTVIEAGPCFVVQKKVTAKDGYEAVQLGFARKSLAKVNKPERGHLEKHGSKSAFEVLREVRVEDAGAFEEGQEVTVEQFAIGERVTVTGTSKGKGFQGVMKRHNFRGGPGGHGSHFHREPGSIGQCASPSRVLKGLGLPGHMGSETVTVRNLEVVKVDTEQNLLLVKGAVPGGKNGLLMIRLA